MEHRATLGLRIAAFVALILTGVVYYLVDGWSTALGFFGCCIPLWFGFSLFVDCLVPVDPHSNHFREATFAMVDTYLIVSLFQNMAPNAAAGSVPQVAFVGLYVFFAAGVSGPLTGAAAGLAGVVGCIPAGSSARQIILLSATSLAAAASGLAWRFCFPLIWRAAEGVATEARRSITPDDTATADELRERLAGMKELLDTVSAERDEAQELAAELEDKLSTAGRSNAAPVAGPPDGRSADEEWNEFEQKLGPLDDSGARKVLQAKARQLMDGRREARMKARALEDQLGNLTREFEAVSNELEAAHLRSRGGPGAEPPGPEPSEEDRQVAAAFEAVAVPAGVAEDDDDSGEATRSDGSEDGGAG